MILCQDCDSLTNGVELMEKEVRTFLICDDTSSNYFVGRFSRTANQVKVQVWELEIGDYLQGKEDHMGIMRWA